MANTVVSIFRDPEQAQQAQNHLLANGFADKQVDIKIASYKSDSQLPDNEVDNNDLIDKITAFFKDLFGNDDEEVTRYSEAGRKGTILTVHTATSEEAEKVADILDSYGAADVNETSGSYFPESDDLVKQHSFLDNPSNSSPENRYDERNIETDARVSRLKSRIVERSIEKNKPTEGY